MKVLSLFDGISCGRLALERAGIPVEKYYASEIDKYAIAVAQKNYPDTIQIGDINTVHFTDFMDVDLIIGGSPCQDLSIAKQNREGLRGARSGLFWRYVDALATIRPKYFLLENVASMRNEDRDAITATLKKIYPETECIMINSALVSAQQRKRYYWTNWHVEQPQDKGILLKDILESDCGFPATMRTREDELGKFKRLETKDDNKANSLTSVQTDSMVAEPITKRSMSNLRMPDEKAKPCLATMYKGSQSNGMTNVPERIGELAGCGTGQANRIYSVRGKSVCLNANGGGGGAKTGLYKVDLPDGDYIIRKLTPVECERLQTLPDGWTDGVSNTQRYKAIGNGWTVDVIAHILKGVADA